MKFDKKTRAAIHAASPDAVVIDWPSLAEEPKKGGKYRLLKAELPAPKDLDEAVAKVREPETPRHIDVMAAMHKRKYGRYPEGYKRPRAKRKSVGTMPRVVVEAVAGDAAHGWKATVRLITDPVQHVRMKAMIRSGPDPITGEQLPTETEPEAMPLRRSRTERAEETDALRLEHKASVDRAVALNAVREARRKSGKKKPGGLAMAAAERAVRRAELSSAAAGA